MTGADSTVAGTTVAHEKRLAFLLRVLVPLIPVLVMILLVRWNYQKGPLDVSLFWNDEVINWHQVKSFSRAGFHSGYYTINERPAPAAFTPFYVHGPWYPMLVGTIARFTGWEIHSGVVLNCLLVSIALYAFVFLTQITNGQLLLLAGILSIANPIVFYLTINMQEALQQAMAIILAMCFSYLFAHQERSPLPARIGLACVILAASITRMSWALLIAPFFLLINRKNARGLLTAVAQTGAMTILVYWVVFETTPPGNHSVFRATAGFATSPVGAMQPFVAHALSNLERYYRFARQSPLDVNQKVAVTTLTLLLLFQLGASLLHNHRLGRGAVQKEDYVTLFHLYNLVGIHCASFALYIIGSWGDYRVIYAHILLSLLLLLLSGRRLPVTCFIAMSLLVLPGIHTYFRLFTERKYAASTKTPSQVYGQVAAALTYDARATNRWCNTVLVDLGLYDGAMTTIPAGLGTSLIFDVRSMATIRSRYLWITDSTYNDLIHRLPEARFKYLLSVPSGKLYFNPAAECHGTASGDH